MENTDKHHHLKMHLLLNIRDFCHVLPPEGIDLGSAGPCRGLAAWSFKVPEICESRGRLQLWWGFFLVAKSQVRKVFFKEWRKSKVKLRSYPMIYLSSDSQVIVAWNPFMDQIHWTIFSPHQAASLQQVKASQGRLDGWGLVQVVSQVQLEVNMDNEELFSSVVEPCVLKLFIYYKCT